MNRWVCCKQGLQNLCTGCRKVPKLPPCALWGIAGWAQGRDAPQVHFLVVPDVSMRFSSKIGQAAEQIPHPSCRSLGNTSLAWILVRAKEVLWPSDRSRMGLQHWDRELGVGWISGVAPVGEGFQPSQKDTCQMQTPAIFPEGSQHELA